MRGGRFTHTPQLLPPPLQARHASLVAVEHVLLRWNSKLVGWCGGGRAGEGGGRGRAIALFPPPVAAGTASTRRWRRARGS